MLRGASDLRSDRHPESGQYYDQQRVCQAQGAGNAAGHRHVRAADSKYAADGRAVLHDGDTDAVAGTWEPAGVRRVPVVKKDRDLFHYDLSVSGGPGAGPCGSGAGSAAAGHVSGEPELPEAESDRPDPVC